MPFPPDLLGDDEELVLDLRPHWWFLAPASAALGVTVLLGVVALINDWPQVIKFLTGILVLAALGFFANRYAVWTTTNFAVTSERIISRFGVIGKQGLEIPLDRINTVFFNQTMFERILGQGDLAVESASQEGRQTFKNIRKPKLVQNEIYRQAEGYEDRRYQRMAGRGGDAPAPAAPSESIPDQIDKLDQLRRQGALTEEEFQAKKRQLLDRL